jgi:lipid A disaccharide synthetase
MPEFLQERCDARLIGPALLEVVENDAVNTHYRDMLVGFRPAMQEQGEKPADRAAAFTLSLI